MDDPKVFFAITFLLVSNFALLVLNVAKLFIE